MTDEASEIHLLADRPRVELPGGTVYQTHYEPILPDTDAIEANDLEMARLKAAEEQVTRRLKDVALLEQVELVGIGLGEGSSVRSVHLTKLVENVDETAVASALTGIDIRYRAH